MPSDAPILVNSVLVDTALVDTVLVDTALVDTHCHLNFEPLVSCATAVIERAAKQHVQKIIVPAYDLASWPQIQNLCDGTSTFPAFGLHPWVAHEPFDKEKLGIVLRQNNAVAVGEIGLDFTIDNVPRERQMYVFAQQLEIATDLNLPVLLHCRGAFEEMLTILEKSEKQHSGILHAFSRGPELAKRFTDLGLHIALGGAITRPGAKRARTSAKIVPLDYIVLETDAPSIGLHNVDPKNVEPKHISNIAATLAEIRGISLAEVAHQTTQNAKRLFRL